MTQKHTPTPWTKFKEHHAQYLEGADRHTTIIGVLNTEFTSAMEDEAEANAAFIVRACNNHEALVEALKEARNALLSVQGEWAGVSEVYAPVWASRLKPRVSQIEAALAAAEEAE